jgi:hypothetical protein
MDSRPCSRAQLLLCLEAHCRSAGHRAYEAKLGAIKKYVAWISVAKNVKVFVQNYLHCIATIAGDKVPRPLGTQLPATKPNEILHFDFLYIGLPRDGKYQYLLLLKEDLSRYQWVVPCRTENSAGTSRTMYYDEYRRKSRPSVITLQRIARSRTVLSSPYASKSYWLSV